MDYDFSAEPAHVTLIGVAGVAFLLAAYMWFVLASACKEYGENALPLNRGDVISRLGHAATATGVAFLLGLVAWLLRGH